MKHKKNTPDAAPAMNGKHPRRRVSFRARGRAVRMLFSFYLYAGSNRCDGRYVPTVIPAK